MNIKPGDIVRLKPFKVICIERDGDVRFEAMNGCLARVSPDFIESVEPRPLQPGDRVTRRQHDGVWTIIAMDDGIGWLRSKDYGNSLAALDDLTRTDQ